MAARGDLPAKRLVPFVAAQLIGALGGVFLAHAMFDVTIVQLSTKSRFGGALWLSEFVATFGLVVAILGTAHSRPNQVAYAVGLYISAAYWFTASTSFANPAVTIARSFSDTFAGIQLSERGSVSGRAVRRRAGRAHILSLAFRIEAEHSELAIVRLGFTGRHRWRARSSVTLRESFVRD